MSLTEYERDLIQAAERTLWNDDLRELLTMAVHARHGVAGRYADCGELADTLEMLAAAPASPYKRDSF